jgi:hypothetical protein
MYVLLIECSELVIDTARNEQHNKYYSCPFSFHECCFYHRYCVEEDLVVISVSTTSVLI